MKKYYCNVRSYDYFSSDKTEHLDLGTKPKEAIEKWKQSKAFDYHYSDSFRETGDIQVIEVFEVEKSQHNFYTNPEDRLHKIPVIGWDGSVIDCVVTTINECLNSAQMLNENGWHYDVITDQIRTLEYTYINSSEFDDLEECWF